MKNTKVPRISPGKRLLYAFVSLLAGDLILLFFPSATRAPRDPARGRTCSHDCRYSSDVHPLCDLLICGLDVCRPAWNVAVPGGLDHTPVLAASADFGRYSGPIALLVIFAVLSRSHIYFRNLAEVSTLLAYTILVSNRFFYGLPGLAAQGNEEQPDPVTTLLPSVVMGLSVRLLRASAYCSNGSSRGDGHNGQPGWRESSKSAPSNRTP